MPTIELDCSNGQQILKRCLFCIMKIPCRYSVKSNNLYLPLRLWKCINNTDKMTLVHPINLPLFQQFFDQDPWRYYLWYFIHIQCPNFKFLNHSFSQYCQWQEQHLSLKRIAKAVKHDGKVFTPLAESMIDGQYSMQLTIGLILAVSLP